jgi:hypothetical protein
MSRTFASWQDAGINLGRVNRQTIRRYQPYAPIARQFITDDAAFGIALRPTEAQPVDVNRVRRFVGEAAALASQEGNP